MVEFATFDRLERSRRTLDESQLLKRASTSVTGKTVFLSHSSKDKRYLPAIISILEDNGGSVYTDLGDNRLPKGSLKNNFPVCSLKLPGRERIVSDRLSVVASESEGFEVLV